MVVASTACIFAENLPQTDCRAVFPALGGAHRHGGEAVPSIRDLYSRDASAP